VFLAKLKTFESKACPQIPAKLFTFTLRILSGFGFIGPIFSSDAGPSHCKMDEESAEGLQHSSSAAQSVCGVRTDCRGPTPKLAGMKLGHSKSTEESGL
jgi:hypothetical protein